MAGLDKQGKGSVNTSTSRASENGGSKSSGTSSSAVKNAVHSTASKVTNTLRGDK